MKNIYENKNDFRIIFLIKKKLYKDYHTFMIFSNIFKLR
jgi:hypothetical protein